MNGTVKLSVGPGQFAAAALSPTTADIHATPSQVLLRRGDALYVTDGVYGSLSDAGAPGFRFPARLLRPDGPPARATTCDYTLFGPTCDSADRMAGLFPLPADIAEGDWIEIGQLGAYGACLRTGFNGFDVTSAFEVRDPPMLS